MANQSGLTKWKHVGSSMASTSRNITWPGNPAVAVAVALNQNLSSSHLESNFSKTGIKNWPALLILVVIFLTVGGNILVILAVSLEKKLQNATNFFLRSLAMADMLVGVLVMPVSLINILYDYAWPLPRALCPMWIFLDVLFSTASIMHLCAISLDRYIGIRNPIQHSRSNSRCMVVSKITTVWTISVVVSMPIPMMGYLDEHKVFVNGSCVLNEERFVLVGSFVVFFIPLLVMVVCYCLTMRVLNRWASALLHDYPPARTPTCTPQPSISSLNLFNDEPAPSAGPPGHPNKERESGILGGQGRRGMAQAIKNQRRASKVLGVVFFLFLVMWCPFFITNVLIALCHGACNGPELEDLLNVFVWVGYISSGVNPLVYTLFNRTYRHAFSHYLRCRYDTARPQPIILNPSCQVYAVTPAAPLCGKGCLDRNRNENGIPVDVQKSDE